MKDLYEDIINRPHHVSKARPQMSELERAAQFSPFAALTGYDAAIKETGRLTDERIELGEEALTAFRCKHCRRGDAQHHTQGEQKARNSFFHLVSSVSLPLDSLKSYFISSIAKSLYITSVAIALISSV